MTYQYKTLQDLGVKTFRIQVMWRHPHKEDFKKGILKGEKFRIGRHLTTARNYLHLCFSADWVSNKKPALIKYRYGEIEASATFFHLPTIVAKSKAEIKEELLSLYPGSSLVIPAVGCQLHGDIDATLELKKGEKIIIPWNY